MDSEKNSDSEGGQQASQQPVSVTFTVESSNDVEDGKDSYSGPLRMCNRPERSNFTLNHVRSIRKAFEVFDWCSYLRSDVAIHTPGVNREYIYSIINSGGFHPKPPTPRNSFSRYVVGSKEQEVINEFVAASKSAEVKPSMYTKYSVSQNTSDSAPKMSNRTTSKPMTSSFRMIKTHSKRFLYNSSKEEASTPTALDRLAEVANTMDSWKRELVNIQTDSPDELTPEKIEAKAEEITARIVPPTPGLPYDYFMEFIMIPHFELFFPFLDSPPSQEESDVSDFESTHQDEKNTFNLASKARSPGDNGSSSSHHIFDCTITNPPSSLTHTERSDQAPLKGKGGAKKEVLNEGTIALSGFMSNQARAKGAFQRHRESNVEATELLFSMLDANADGLVSWEDFSNFILQQGQRQLLESELHSAKKREDSNEKKEGSTQATESLIRYGINFEPSPCNRNLWQETYPLVSYLYHSEPISKMVCSTRSSKFITASADGNVKMWKNDKTLADAEGRGSITHERTILSVRAPITDLVLSSPALGNSELVAVAAMDGTISLLRSHSGELIRTLLGIRQTKSEEDYALAQFTSKRSSGRRSKWSRSSAVDRRSQPSDDKDQTGNQNIQEGSSPVACSHRNAAVTTPVLVTPAFISTNENTSANHSVPPAITPTGLGISSGAGSGATYVAPNSRSTGANTNTGSTLLQRYKYTINAYKKDALEIFFGKASKYFKGLDVVPPTYEHLKRPGSLTPDVLYSFGFGKRILNSKFSAPSTSWFASSLALERYPDYGVYSTLSPGAYIFLGFESGVLQVYGLNENWFTTTQQSATRVEPSAAREPLFSAQVQESGISSIIISPQHDFIFFAGTDGTIGFRNFSKLHVPLNQLGAPSIRPSANISDTMQRRIPFFSKTVGHTKRITSMSWHENYGILVSGSADHCVAFWSPRSSTRPMRIIDLRETQQRASGMEGTGNGEGQAASAASRACGYPVDISFIARPGDPLSVLVLDNRRFIRILDISSGHCISVLSDDTCSTGVSKNAKRLLSGGGESRIERQLESSLRVVRYDPEEDRLVLGGRFPRVWNIRKVDAFSKDYVGHRKPVICMDYTSSLELWVTADMEHIVLWKLTFDRKNQLTRDRNSTVSRIESGAYSKNFSLMLEKGLFNTSKGDAVTRLVRTWVVEEGIRNLAIDRDGRAAYIYVALMFEDAIVQYNSYNGTALRRLAFPPDTRDIYSLNAAEALLSKAEVVPSLFVCAAFDSTSTYGKGATAVYHANFPGSISGASNDTSRKGTNNSTQTVENIYSPTEARRILFSDYGASSVVLVPHLGAILIGSLRVLLTTPISDATSRPIPCRTLTDDLGLYMRAHRETLKRESVALSLDDTENSPGGQKNQRRRYLAFLPGRLLNLGVSSGDKDLFGMGENAYQASPHNASHQRRSVHRSHRKSTALVGNNSKINTSTHSNDSDPDFITTTEKSLVGFLDILCPVAETGYLFSGSNHGLLQLWSIRSYSEVIRFFVTPYGAGITSLEFLASQFLSSSRFSNHLSHRNRHQKKLMKSPTRTNLPDLTKDVDSAAHFKGKHLLSIGDEHGHVLVLDFNSFNWYDTSQPLDVVNHALEEDVVVLARWRAHRGYVSSIRFVVDNTSFPVPTHISDEGKALNSSCVQQFSLCTSGEDAYTYIWSWNNGSISCLGCFGAGLQTPILPPLLNIHSSTQKALEQLRRRYINEHLMRDENFFAEPRLIDDLDRAMAFIFSEQRQMIEADSVWLLAELYQAALENFALPFLAEKRKKREKTESLVSIETEKKQSMFLSGAILDFKDDEAETTPQQNRSHNFSSRGIELQSSSHTVPSPLAFAFCPSTFIEEENETPFAILKRLVTESLEAIAVANRKKRRSTVNATENGTLENVVNLKSATTTPFRSLGSPIQPIESPMAASTCHALNGLFDSPSDQTKKARAPPLTISATDVPLFPSSSNVAVINSTTTVIAVKDAPLNEKSAVLPTYESRPLGESGSPMRCSVPPGRSQFSSTFSPSSRSTLSTSALPKSSDGSESKMDLGPERGDAPFHNALGVEMVMERVSECGSPLNSGKMPKTPGASTSAPTSHAQTERSLPGQIKFRGTDGLPLYKTPLNESLALARAAYMISEKDAVESHHHKAEATFSYVPDNKAPLAIISSSFKRPQDEGYIASPTAALPASLIQPTQCILVKTADNAESGGSNAQTMLDNEVSVFVDDDSDNDQKDAADVILKASRERRNEIGGPQSIAQCRPFRHPKFVERISIEKKRGPVKRSKDKVKHRKKHKINLKITIPSLEKKDSALRYSILTPVDKEKGLQTSPLPLVVDFHPSGISFFRFADADSTESPMNLDDRESSPFHRDGALFNSALTAGPLTGTAHLDIKSSTVLPGTEFRCGSPPFVEHSVAGDNRAIVTVVDDKEVLSPLMSNPEPMSFPHSEMPVVIPVKSTTMEDTKPLPTIDSAVWKNEKGSYYSGSSAETEALDDSSATSFASSENDDAVEIKAHKRRIAERERALWMPSRIMLTLMDWESPFLTSNRLPSMPLAGKDRYVQVGSWARWESQHKNAEESSMFSKLNLPRLVAPKLLVKGIRVERVDHPEWAVASATRRTSAQTDRGSNRSSIASTSPTQLMAPGTVNFPDHGIYTRLRPKTQTKTEVNFSALVSREVKEMKGLIEESLKEREQLVTDTPKKNEAPNNSSTVAAISEDNSFSLHEKKNLGRRRESRFKSKKELVNGDDINDEDEFSNGNELWPSSARPNKSESPLPTLSVSQQKNAQSLVRIQTLSERRQKTKRVLSAQNRQKGVTS